MNVSMVITTYNRAELLDRSLSRLAVLTLPDELIVVNDGGDDDTGDVVWRFREATGIPVAHLYNDNPGPSICSMARNIGIKQARYNWIITSEPELIYRTDVVAQFTALSLTHPSEIISAGRVYFAPDGWAGEGLRPEDFELDPEPGRITAGDYAPPPDCQEAVGWVAPHTALWKRSWLMEVGGWDEEFPGPWGWDDTDLLTRLRIMGHGQHIAPEVEAIHQFHPLGGDVGSVNEEYFLAKSFHNDQSPNNDDVVANRGREWGKR